MTTHRPVRVRFCPSPTGFLHIGGVRTALFNYLFAKQQGGTFILRLEDTDRERFVPEGVNQIVEVLKWAGLTPDEGYWEGEHSGNVGPYIQSERLPQYRSYVDTLLQKGLAYESSIEPDAFGKLREAAIAAKKPFVYRRSFEPSTNGRPAANRPIRLDIAAVQKHLKTPDVVWIDEVRGKFAIDWETLDDFIILKADGFPTYNFANVVDDALMKISHILRGDEFISSTPKHAILYDALGFDRPVWAHLPVILGSDGAKLSKRHGDTDALQYRDKGYLPEALLNFLALLGWNNGTEQEVFSVDELIREFSLDRIQKSPAKFDMERLNWMNGVFIREKLTEKAYVSRALDEMKAAGLPTDAKAREVVLLERERVKAFADLPEMVSFFFQRPHYTQSVIDLLTKKSTAGEVQNLLKQALDALSSLKQNDLEVIETALRDRVQELGIGAGQFFYPIRVALTGRTAAPGLFETIHALGREEAIARLDAAIQALA